MPRRRTPQLIVIYWRHIPSQVNGQAGGTKHQILLKPRFEKAIDRAAMAAGITTASDYVNEWRRETVPVDGDVTSAAQALAERLEDEHPIERLNELAANHGWRPGEEPEPAPETGLDATSEPAGADRSIAAPVTTPEGETP